MSSRVAACLVLFLICTSLAGQTNPGAHDSSQEAFVFDQLAESVRFESDGSGVRETTAAIRIQSQAGVQAFGQLVFGYSSANEDLKVDYVRVRTADGEVLTTPASTAQDFAPEILHSAPMYSDFRERHISVVGIRPGVVLEYHVIVTVKPLAAGEFWYEYSFPRNYALKNGTLRIDIPKARTLKIKSPDHKFETQEQGDRRIYTWTVNDFVPDRKADSDEEESDSADVQMSTFASWREVASWYSKLQSERAVPDDAVRKKAAELTRGADTQEAKVRALYAFVAQNIRYVSLSFGVGRFQPHAAPDVLQNGYGDCKDKHTLLQALLAAEGIESYPVLIHSERKLDEDVPSPAQFDHVITLAKVDGKLTWLDATAEVAPYGLIAYQLRNKEALVASTDSFGGLQRTPSDAPVKNKTTLTVDARFSELGALDANVDLVASGDSGWPLRAVFREVAEKDWPRALEYVSRTLGLPGDVSDVKTDAADSIAKPFHVSYHLHKADFFKVPNSGANFQLLPRTPSPALAKLGKNHRSEPLNIGPAEETEYQVRIEFPPNFTPHVASDVSVTRDYGEYSTSYKLSKNVLEAKRRLVVKVNELPAFRRADYESFHNVTANVLEETPWCSIKPPSASAEASAAQLQGTAAELREAGESALKRQDFTAAAALLARAADQEPNAKEGWYELGQAYAGLSQHEKAADAFRKQLQVDPSHPHANGELARQLQELGKFDDAVAAYRKQIELAPADKSAHKELGLLFVQLKRDREAAAELEAAASLPPEDPEIKMALSQVYSRLGEGTKAETLMTSLTGGSASSADFFAPALRDDIDLNQTEHDAIRNLGDIGDQFESGAYDHLDPNDFAAMDLVALSWARLGWVYFLRGDNLQASQYLEAAWSLSLSGTVANRLGRVYEKTGARDHARQMYALSVAAGGPEANASRERMAKLGPANTERELTKAKAELDGLRFVALPALTNGVASARFEMLFDNSTSPQRVRYEGGDDSLRNVAEKLEQVEYPVKFPDISSIKIILSGTISCKNSGCRFELDPLKSMEQGTAPELATVPKKD